MDNILKTDIYFQTCQQERQSSFCIANVYRQTTDKLMFKSVMNQKMEYSKMCYQQAKYIDIHFEVCVFFKESAQ